MAWCQWYIVHQWFTVVSEKNSTSWWNGLHLLRVCVNSSLVCVAFAEHFHSGVLRKSKGKTAVCSQQQLSWSWLLGIHSDPRDLHKCTGEYRSAEWCLWSTRELGSLFDLQNKPAPSKSGAGRMGSRGKWEADRSFEQGYLVRATFLLCYTFIT